MTDINIFESLQNKCKEADTTLSEVCREAGIDRSIPEYWKKKTPKTLIILSKLEAAISEIKAKKDAEKKKNKK